MSNKKKPNKQKKAPAKKNPTALTKKRSAKKTKSRGKPKLSGAAISKTHAGALMSHVNSMLAARGFSAHVTAMHFTADCATCTPPQVCKRVCERQPNGTVVCRNECA